MPLAPVEVSPEQLDGPGLGVSLIGLLRPVLEAPAWVERDRDSLTFHRAVVGPDGAVRGYASVRLDGKRVRIWVSTEPGIDPLISAPPGSVVADAVSAEEAMFKSLVLSVQTVSPGSDSQNASTVMVPDFDLAAALLGWGADFFKSEHGPIPAGARWITVHPNGDGSKGTPALFSPVKDGSGQYRVIAGAGGKLNMLKIRGLKAPDQYRAQHAERAQAKRARLKDQQRRDRDLGIHYAKGKARKALAEQRKAAEKSFIKTIAEAMGWDAAALNPSIDDLSPEAQKKAEAAWQRDLLTEGKAAVDTQRRVLIADAQRRKDAGLDVLPTVDAVGAITAADLDPVRPGNDGGVSPQFAKRAETAGLTEESKAEQVAAAKTASVIESKTPSDLAAAIAEELKGLAKPELLTSNVEADKAIALPKA